MAERKPYTFDRVVRLIITIVCVVAVLMLINRLKDVLLPFCVACLIAYIIEPLVRYNKKLLHFKGRIIPIFITLFELATLFGILGYFFIPSIIEETHQIGRMLSTYAKNGADIPFLPDTVHVLLRNHINFDKLSEMLSKQDFTSIASNAESIISGGVGVLLSIVSWLIVILYVIFILIDYDKLMEGFKNMVPPKFRKPVYKIGNDIKTSMNLYFRGQALIALIVAVLYSAGFLIIGLPLAVVMGLTIGVLFMVPYMQYISLIPVTLLCLVYSTDQGIDFWPIMWETIMVYAIVQVIADLILTPKIMGKAMGLNPAIILLSLSVWGSLLGLIGMIIALPLTTLLLSYYDAYIAHQSGAKSGKLLEEIETTPMD